MASVISIWPQCDCAVQFENDKAKVSSNRQTAKDGRNSAYSGWERNMHCAYGQATLGSAQVIRGVNEVLVFDQHQVEAKAVRGVKQLEE